MQPATQAFAGTPVAGDIVAEYFSPCDQPSSAAKFCWACWCTTCYHGEVKANLDGRQYDCCCDCCCTPPEAALYMRRQLRAKYGLQQDITPRTCSCSGTYNEDVWKPCAFACLLSIPAVLMIPVRYFVPGRMLQTTNFLWNLPGLAYDMQTIQTEKEMIARNSGLAHTYGANGFAPPLAGAYQFGLCDCCAKDYRICCYVCWCTSCAAASMAAELQGRECDCCDCLESTNPYLLRRTLKAKYGIQQNATRDCCLACWCYECMMCQDFQELRARNSKQHYLAVAPTEGMTVQGSAAQIPLAVPMAAPAAVPMMK